MHFSEYLEKMLTRHNLNQTVFAEMIGVDSSLVSYWIAEKRYPHHKKLPKIIKLFALTEQEEKEHLHQIYFKPKTQENK